MIKFLGYLLARLHWMFPRITMAAFEYEAAWIEEEFACELLDCETEDGCYIAPCERDNDPDCYLCTDYTCGLHPKNTDASL